MPNEPSTRGRPTALALLAIGALCVGLAYWVGLQGPLLLDDFGNLADVIAWQEGNRTWQSVVLNNRSGIGGRPLAMASFVLDAALWGGDVWHFKLTGLLLHLACGVMLYGLYRQIAARDRQLSQAAPWVAALLAVLWMSLPILASSVLYVVQRMAILAALFSFSALWLFIVARERIERGERHGATLLLIGVPLLTTLAFLSKENGALVPLLALAIEVAYFQRSAWRQRSRAVLLFFSVFLVLPAVAALVGVGLRPERILDTYVLRDFTMGERLLTQPRILWDYVGSVFVPYTPRLGIFHDNFPKSTGLLAPWTTLVSIAAWLFALVAAWRWRKRHPAVLCGLLLFLFGHAMESSVFGLELYFEHRNYLPSAGLLLAAAGLVAAALARMPARSATFRRALPVLPLLLLVTCLLATHGRARVWSSLETLYAQELAHNPTSPRLRSYLAGEAIRNGDTAEALRHIGLAEAHQAPSQGMTATLWKLLAHCAGTAPAPAGLYREAEQRARGPIQTFAMVAWENLVQRIERGDCNPVDVAETIRLGQTWLGQADMDSAMQHVWRTRYNLARLMASQSRFEEAAAQGERAWIESGYNNGIGVFLFQVNATLGRREACEAILARLRKSYGSDFKLNRAIDTFSRALEENAL